MKEGAWKDYFSFSKKERIAIFILLIIIAVFIVLPYLYAPDFKKPVVDEKLEQQLISKQPYDPNKFPLNDSTSVNNPTDFNASATQTIARDLFYFDPNTLDALGFQRLGLRDKTINTILNYRSKGGYFRTPEDIRKIYGLKKEEADALIPFVKIQSAKQQKEIQATVSSADKNYPENSHTIKKININTATAEEWKALPGIGDVLSNRIVKFRNMLHGFSTIDDIKKTYGLSDSTFQLIRPYLILPDSSAQ